MCVVGPYGGIGMRGLLCVVVIVKVILYDEKNHQDFLVVMEEEGKKS